MDGLLPIVAAITAFAITALLGLVIVPYLHKLKYGQTILDIGPNWHKSKQGTPTMGGIMFILGVIAAAAVSFPIMYRTARGALEQVDENLINAGRTLGMSESRIFFKILLPMSRPGIAAAAILSFARALGEFGATMMLAGNIPGRTQTMSIAIYTAMQGGNREKAYVWVAVIMAMSFGVMILMNLWNDRQNRRKKI